MSSLKRKSDFRLLFESGRKVYLQPWLFLVYRYTRDQELRTGLTISRKVGNAVTRNRLKRMSKVIFQNYSPSIKGVDVNLVFRPQKGDFFRRLKFESLQQQLDRGFEKVKRSGAL